jgi:hypothetical protein
MLTRIAQHSTHTISATFDAAEPVTIEILKGDGTELVEAGTATTGAYEYELTPAQTTDLDRLTARWTDADGQIVTTYHDVVGAHLISLAALRKHEPLDDEATYPDEDLAEARDLASYALERACNRAFTRRYGRETVTAGGGRYLPLTARRVASVSAVFLGDEAVELDGSIVADAAGYLDRPNGSWRSGARFTVEYIHGEEVADPRVSRAVALIAADILYSDALDGSGSGIPDRATSVNSDAGTFALVTAGVGGAAFQIPEVNSVVESYRIP